MWEFLDTINPRIAAITAFFSIIGLLEKVSKFKPLTLFLAWIGSKTNAKLASEVCELKTEVAEIKKDVCDNRYKSVKKEILDFAGALMNGKQHTKEQFAHILEVIDEYETVFAVNHNGETKQTIQFIKGEYDAFMKDKRTKNKKEKEK